MSAEKEVIMDVKEGGGKKRRGSRRRKVGSDSDAPTTVTKAGADTVPQSAVKNPGQSQTVALVKKPVVVLAPPKKKVPKVMLVPKGGPSVKPVLKKTFKAKKIKVLINNTAKTQKQHRSIIEDVDAMTDDQVRAAACAAKLSRRETVSKAPITLLRQMIKDLQLMKKQLH
jgi:hypothetical protein